MRNMSLSLKHLLAGVCVMTAMQGEPAAAQCRYAWRQVDNGGPAPRYLFPAAAYDAARQNVVLFGGRNAPPSNTLMFDTWVWNGSIWILKNPTHRPSARDTASIVYDSVRQECVLFGGQLSGDTSLETWVWNGTDWTDKTAGVPLSPDKRCKAAFAFDPVAGKAILFGGSTNGSEASVLGDTWAWDGTAWTKLQDTGSGPPKRALAAMCYDPGTQRIVLFGGRDGATAFGDTWEWNGSSWAQVATAGPSPRMWHAMTYDATLGKVILFGGLNITGGFKYYGDVWAWDGATMQWSQLDVGGIETVPYQAFDGSGGRASCALVHYADMGATMVFGGNNRASVNGETWVLDLSVASPAGDLNGDGMVDQADLGILLANYGQGCP